MNIRKSQMKPRLTCYHSRSQKWWAQQISGDHPLSMYGKDSKIFTPLPSSSTQMYPFKDPLHYIVGNEAKGRISKRVFQESKARQNFRKTNISYPLIRG